MTVSVPLPSLTERFATIVARVTRGIGDLLERWPSLDPARAVPLRLVLLTRSWLIERQEAVTDLIAKTAGAAAGAGADAVPVAPRNGGGDWRHRGRTGGPGRRGGNEGTGRRHPEGRKIAQAHAADAGAGDPRVAEAAAPAETAGAGTVQTAGQTLQFGAAVEAPHGGAGRAAASPAPSSAKLGSQCSGGGNPAPDPTTDPTGRPAGGAARHPMGLRRYESMSARPPPHVHIVPVS